MLNLKNTTIAILALSSSAVFAGTMGPVCVPGNVTVPCEATAWDFGGYALYLNTTHNGSLGYLDTYTDTNGFTNYIDRNNKWGWGFKLEGSYHYGMGNDVNLNWYHLSNSYDRAFLSGDARAVQGNTLIAHASTVKPSWDAVNLEFGQHVDFTEYSKARFHAGAQYARLKTSASGVYTDPAPSPEIPTGFVNAFDSSATYNGFGPRAGMDLNYGFGNGFGVYGNSAATLLVGTSKFARNAGLIATPTNVFSLGGSSTSVVPELEAKLGAMYTCAMASGDLTLDAGYMWVNYFGANSSPLNGSSITAVPSNNVGYSDFGLNGVYFGLKWVGNIA